MTTAVTGKTLIGWGLTPGPHFAEMIEVAQNMRELGDHDDEIVDVLRSMVPVRARMLSHPLPYRSFLRPQSEVEEENRNAVHAHMDEVVRLPTVEKAAVMPDACPVGQKVGTIPVGGVVACRDAIHPGFHSEDVCCSVAMTVLNSDVSCRDVLDRAEEVTHFGPGGRQDDSGRPNLRPSLLAEMRGNPFLSGLEDKALSHMGTQGDGNHFLFVGRRLSDGRVCLVTHHGSRGFGAEVYRRGMKAAQRHTRKVSEGVPPHNAWLSTEGEEGRDYWHALQAVRKWTFDNHRTIHSEVVPVDEIFDRVWNEHNFVFRRDDGLFYHAKGATPSFGGYDKTLIPTSMADPVLVCEPTDRPDALGFAPHGAGRNVGRRKFMRETVGDQDHDEFLRQQTAGLDVRFWSGLPDLSELPGAYKNARQIEGVITSEGLAQVVDRVLPYGCIMAGRRFRPS